MKNLVKTAGIGLLVAAVASVLIAGCAKAPETPVQDTQFQEITVLVPCGQQGPFYEVKDLFEAANPGIKVQEKAENIAVLTKKIMDGIESPEVFMSLGDREISLLQDKGRILEGTITEYADNCLALIGPREGAVITTLKDVAGPEVETFVMVEPEGSSAGYHAREALQSLGIWEEVKAKTRIPEQPEMVAQGVAKGDAQAGVAYWPCIYETHDPNETNPKPRKKIVPVEVISQDLYTPFRCTAAVIEGAENPEMGKKFIAFLNSPEAQEVFRKWFFMSPEEAAKVQAAG